MYLKTLVKNCPFWNNLEIGIWIDTTDDDGGDDLGLFLEEHLWATEEYPNNREVLKVSGFANISIPLKAAKLLGWFDDISVKLVDWEVCVDSGGEKYLKVMKQKPFPIINGASYFDKEIIEGSVDAKVVIAMAKAGKFK